MLQQKLGWRLTARKASNETIVSFSHAEQCLRCAVKESGPSFSLGSFQDHANAYEKWRPNDEEVVLTVPWLINEIYGRDKVKQRMMKMNTESLPQCASAKGTGTGLSQPEAVQIQTRTWTVVYIYSQSFTHTPYLDSQFIYCGLIIILLL